MKIFHFSDTHLGFSEYNKIDPDTGINQREQDFYRAWDRVVECILASAPDVVVHAGDLFHTPRPSNRALHVAMDGIQQISQAGIPFVLVAGNHETPRIKATGSIFESIALFENIYASYNCRYNRFRIGEVDFHCLPHCSLTEEMEETFRAVQLQPDAQANVLVTHGAWSGRQLYSMGEFNEQRLPDIEGLLGITFDYIALGHYHRRVDIRDHICYCGSTERTSFNEHNSTCGYLLVDLQTMEKQYHEIQTRPMFKLPTIDCNGLQAQEIYDVLERQSSDELADAMVQLTLRDIDENTFLKLDLRKIDDIFSRAFYLEKYLFRKAREGESTAAGAHIGSLTMEFERYLSEIKVNDFDSEKLVAMGNQYLAGEE